MRHVREGNTAILMKKSFFLKYLQLLLLAALVCLVVGCGERELPKDDFLNKWENIVEQTKNSTTPVDEPARDYSAEACINSVVFDTEDDQTPGQCTPDLPKIPITLDLRKPVPVGTVLKLLAQAGKRNIVFNPIQVVQENIGMGPQNLAANAANVAGAPVLPDLNRKINLSVTDAPWDDVFRSVLNAQGLAYRCEGSIIRVMSLQDLQHMNKLEEARRLSSANYGTGFFRLKYADVNDVKQTVADFVGAKIYGSPYGGEKITEKVSGEYGGDDSGVLSIIRSDQNKQNKDDTNDDEIKDSMMYSRVVVDQLTNTLIVRARQKELVKVKSLISCLDRPRKKILITAFIVKTSRSVARELGIQWGWSLKGWKSGTPIQFRNGQNGISGSDKYGINFPSPSAAKSLDGKFPTSGAAGNFLLGFLDGNYLEMQLSALDEDGKVNIISSPTIVTLDNQGGYIANGLEIPYQKSIASTGQTEVSYEFKEAVLKLEIVPRVIDSETIKMKIAVTDNSVDRSAQLDKLDEVASIRTRETETVMTVRNNQTLVISGLTESTDDWSESGIPGLKDVAGIGWLGKNQKKEKSQDQLMVFIRPTIIH